MRAILLNKTLGGILLVAGVAIGAGMLALPITTGLDGFRNASFLLIGVYIATLYSLFLTLEISLYSEKPDANMISAARQFLGSSGQMVAWLSFLMLLYAACAAYISGGGSLLTRVFTLTGWPYPAEQLGILLFVVLFGGIAFISTLAVDVINKIFMAGMILAFAVLLMLMGPHVNIENIKYNGPNEKYLLAALPIVILSFTCQIILPSLRHYLNGNVPQLKRVMLWGSLLPLVCYLIWNFLVLGVFPVEGPSGLEVLSHAEYPVKRMTVVLQENFNMPTIALVVGIFSICALVTSFLAVILSLMDFMSDGLKIQKNPEGRLILACFSIIPPLLFALFFPHAFLTAIGYAGVFIAILYGILPVLMAWRVRYILKLPLTYQAPFGKIGLVVLFLAAVAVIVVEIITRNVI